jgi:hypothetical protein
MLLLAAIALRVFIVAFSLKWILCKIKAASR